MDKKNLNYGEKEMIERRDIYFSIIVPCYNLEKYISKTIDSIVNQTFQNFEIIIIDDGSKDKSLEIIQKRADIEDRIKVISQTNQGVSEARNIGLLNARGRYIYFMDGDDLIEDSLLNDAYNIFEKNKKIQMYSFAYDLVGNNKYRVYKNKKGNNKIFSSNKFLNLFFKRKIYQSICSFIVEREILKNKKFIMGMTHGEDQAFQIELLLEEFNIYYTSKIYFHYIMRDGSAMNSKIKIKNLMFLEFLLQLNKNKKIFNFKKNYIEFSQIVFFYTLKEIAKKGTSIEDNIKIQKKLAEINEKLINEMTFLSLKSRICRLLGIFYKKYPEIIYFLLKKLK